MWPSSAGCTCGSSGFLPWVIKRRFKNKRRRLDAAPRAWVAPDDRRSVTALGVAELPPLSHRLAALAEPAPAPTLHLDDLDGDAHDLANLRGRLVLVNF